MNLHRPRAGEYYTALYEEQIERGKYASPVSFNFKATDDEQFKLKLQQYSQGRKVDVAGFSIYTTDNIKFKNDSRITISMLDRAFKIEETREMFNTPLNLVNASFPDANFNKGKWIKLGEI